MNERLERQLAAALAWTPAPRRHLRRWAPVFAACTLIATAFAVIVPLTSGPGGVGRAAAIDTTPAPGPVILDGTDSGLHGSVNTAGVLSASQLNSTWVYELKAWETLFANVPSTYAHNGKVALVGASDSTTTSNNCGGAAHYISQRVTGGPITVDYFEGATAIGTLFDDVLAGTANYELIQIVEQNWCGNGMSDAEAVVVNARGPAIAAHVNRGGALFTQSQSYGWLSSLFSTLSKSNACSGSTPSLTDAGYAQFPGLTNSNIAAPWHNCFTVSSGSFPLTQLAIQSGTATVILGGTSVALPSNITVVTDNTQPRPGETVCTTATVTNTGSPVSGASVQFSVNGVVITPSVSTDSSGHATYCYVKVGSGGDIVTATVLSGPGIGSTSATIGWSNVALSASPGQALSRGMTVCVDATAGTFSGSSTTPSAGIAVAFSVTGVNTSAPATVNTNGSGVAQYCYTGTEGGVDTVSAAIGSGPSLDVRSLAITWTGPRVTVPAISHPASGTGKVVPITVAEFTGSADLWASLSLPASSGTLTVNTSGLTLTQTVGASFTAQDTLEFTGTLSAITSALASRVTWNAPSTGRTQTLSVSVRNDADPSAATMTATAAPTLTSTVSPVVSTNPANANVSAGVDAVFSASATGYPSPTVEWQISTDSGSTYSTIVGETGATLTVSTLQSMNNNRYRARFTNLVGFVSTTGATLTVTAPVASPQVITIGALADTPVNRTAPVVSASVDSGLSLTVTAGPSGVCTISSLVLTLVAPGICTVTASQAGNINHDPATATSTFEVLGTSVQTVMIMPLQDMALDDMPQMVMVSLDSGLSPDITVAPPSVCTISGMDITAVGMGTCTVSVSQAGDAQHDPATGSATFEVGPPSMLASQMITFGALSDVPLNGTPPTVSATVDSGLSLTFTAAPPSVCTISGTTLTLIGTGTCTVTAVQAGDMLHDPATMTRSFAVTSPTVTIHVLDLPSIPDTPLDQSPIVLPATTADGLPISYTAGPASVCSMSGTNLVLVGVGTCTVVASAIGDQTHVPASTTKVFEVRPSTLTLNLDLAAGQSVGGAPVDVEGHGLKPFSEVRIELHSTPILLGTVMTDAEGSFKVRVSLPSVVPAGSHTIIAMGQTPEGAPVNAREPIFVDWAGAIAAIPALSGYTPISPVRVLDTRAGGKLAAGETYRLEFPADLLPSDVTAVVLNLSISQAEDDGFVTVYPCTSARPWASAANYVVGVPVSNLVVALQTAGAKLCLYTMSAAHLVVDLEGFHHKSGANVLAPNAPVRLLDTRTGTELAAGEVAEVQVIGAGRAPVDAEAAAMYVAVTEAEGAGFLTVFPCGSPMPLAANLNYRAGSTVGNDVIAKIGTSGKVCVYSLAAVHLVVDLDASFVPASGGGSYTALVAGRLSDTRLSSIVAAGQVVELDVVGENAAPAGAAAVSVNVAVTEGSGAGFVTVYPCGVDRPLAANLNFARGQTVASHVTAQVGAGGKVCVFSSASTHVVVDVEGYYRPLGA